MVMLWRWPVCRRENGQVRGGQFSGERMVMLHRWSVQWRENDHRDFVRLMQGQLEGEWSCYGGGQFNGGSMIMLTWWPG